MYRCVIADIKRVTDQAGFWWLPETTWNGLIIVDGFDCHAVTLKQGMKVFQVDIATE
jgi:hypothetical protein